MNTSKNEDESQGEQVGKSGQELRLHREMLSEVIAHQIAHQLIDVAAVTAGDAART